MTSVDLCTDGEEPPSWLPDLAQIASFVLPRLEKTEWEISALLCNTERMAQLNHDYRGVDGPTDVLTFSQNEGETIPGSTGLLAGDVAICPAVVNANADLYGVSPKEEMIRVFTHALLHLCGYAHDNVDLSLPEAREHPMLSLQEDLVAMMIREKEH